MTIMAFRKKTIMLESEVTYGVDPTPTGADLVETFNLTITPYAGPTVQKIIDRSTYGGYSTVNVSPVVEVSFDVYLAGSGAADTAPNYGKALLACAMDETIGSPGQVEYGPVSASFGSCTIYFEHDGNQHIVTGTRGTYVVTFAAGELPRISFTMTGRYNDPTAASTGSQVAANVGNVNAVTNTNTTTATLFGQTVSLVNLTMDIGNQVTPENIPNTNEIFLPNREATGSITMLQDTIDSTSPQFNWYTTLRSDNGVSTGVLAIVHGTSAGNIVELDAPAVQLSNPQVGERNGNATLTMDLSYLPSAGNDDFTITTK